MYGSSGLLIDVDMGLELNDGLAHRVSSSWSFQLLVRAYTELCSGLTTLILLVCGLTERHVAHIELALTAVRAVRAIDAILRDSKESFLQGLFTSQDLCMCRIIFMYTLPHMRIIDKPRQIG